VERGARSAIPELPDEIATIGPSRVVGEPDPKRRGTREAAEARSHAGAAQKARVANSSCERRRPLGFLAVEAGCERLTLLIVRKFNRDIDCVSVLIINKPSRLVPMAIKPFAHRRHLVSKIRGVHSNSNSTHSHPLPVDAPRDRYVSYVFKILELKLNPDQSQPRKPLSGNG
jgi:hypothetical protein